MNNLIQRTLVHHRNILSTAIYAPHSYLFHNGRQIPQLIDYWLFNTVSAPHSYNDVTSRKHAQRMVTLKSLEASRSVSAPLLPPGTSGLCQSGQSDCRQLELSRCFPYIHLKTTVRQLEGNTWGSVADTE